MPVVYRDVSGRAKLGFVDEEAAASFENFVASLRDDGYNPTFTYLFRTTEQQTAEYELRASNPNPVAVPGTSAHESGLAFDINRNGLARQGLSLKALRDAAAQFGFVPLPDGSDPPHLQFNGSVTISKRNPAYLARIKRNQAHYNRLMEIYNSEFATAPGLRNPQTHDAVLQIQALMLHWYDLVLRCGYHGEACDIGGHRRW
jgi:hypothetical protein